MPEIEYKIRYTADSANAIAGIDRLVAKVNQLDALVDRVKAKLSSLGKSVNVATAMGSIGNLGRAIEGLDSISVRATAAVKKVGTGTRPMTDAAAKAAKLTQELGKTESQAGRTSAALHGVGGGMHAGVGGGGGGGVGGGGGSAGVGKRMAAQVGANLVMRVVDATVGAYSSVHQEHRDFQTETAEKALAFRNERRELAGLMGHSSPNEAVIKSSLNLMRLAGMSSQEEATFSTEYYGSAAIGRDKGNLGAPGADRDKLEDQIRTVGAQFGVRAGIDPKTAGDLTGMIGAYSKIRSARDVGGKLAAFHYGLDQGRGRMTDLTKAALSQAGAAISDDSSLTDLAKSGRVSGVGEMGAFIGVMSAAAKGAGSSGTNYGQLSRLLNRATGEEAEFLKAAGVADKKGDFNKLVALDAHLKSRNVTDVRRYLAEQGFGNETDLKATTHALNQLPVIKARTDEANRREANPDEFIRKNVDFLTSQLGTELLARTNVEAADLERGVQTESLLNLRLQGRAHRTGKDHILPQRGTTSGGIMSRFLNIAGAGDGEQELDEVEGIQLLQKRYKALGKDIKLTHPALMNQIMGASWMDPFEGRGRTSQTDAMREREVASATAEIEGLEKAAREQQEAAAKLNQAAGVMLNAANRMNGGAGGPQRPGAVQPMRP